MAVQVSVDALDCFASIEKSLALWMSRVDNLMAHTAMKRAQFSDEYQKLTHVQMRRRKNSSCHSIRPVKEVLDHLQGTSVPPDSDAANSTAKALNTRKRGTDQASSTQSADDSRVVRMQYRLIIYYDEHTQRELEQVVQDIASARNYIRKGKRTQFMKRPDSALDFFSKRISLREASRSVGAPSDGTRPSAMAIIRSAQKGTPFEFADEQLELAQSLCEDAAHRFLRSGDCLTGLEDIQQKLMLVLEVAKSEVNRLMEEKTLEEGKATT